jgi:hypothetical protein
MLATHCALCGVMRCDAGRETDLVLVRWCSGRRPAERGAGGHLPSVCCVLLPKSCRMLASMRDAVWCCAVLFRVV